MNRFFRNILFLFLVFLVTCFANGENKTARNREDSQRSTFVPYVSQPEVTLFKYVESEEGGKLVPDKALAPNSLKVVDSYITENVIIVTMDGMRIYESLLDPDHQYAPHLWNDLRPQGATNLLMQMSVVPSSVSGHYTILTGAREVLALDGNDLEGYRPRVPTIFEYYRKTFSKPETSVFYISSKGNLTLRSSYSTHPLWGESYGAIPASSIAPTSKFQDIYTWDTTAEIIDEYHPNLMLVNFFAVDQIGHGGDYDEWTDTVELGDTYVYELWNKIQADSIYSGKTALIIMTDHGRSDDDHSGFKDHGGEMCEGCRRIQFVALGPDFKQGYTFGAFRKLVDVAPTVGELLGFDTPYAEGQVMWELFSGIKRESVEKAASVGDAFAPKIEVVKDGSGYHAKILKVVMTETMLEQVSFSDVSDIGTFDSEIAISKDSSFALNPDIAFSNSVLHTVHFGWLPTDGTYSNDRDWQQLFYRRSTDYGATWSEKVLISDYVTPLFPLWYAPPTIGAQNDFVIAAFPSDAAIIGINRSLDNGQTWEGFSAIGGLVHPRSVGVGLNNNYVHIVFYDLNELHSEAGNIDIYYVRSEDYGETWSWAYSLTSEPETPRSSFEWNTSIMPEVFDKGDDRNVDSCRFRTRKTLKTKPGKYGVKGKAFETPEYFDEVLQFNPDIAVSGSNVHIVWAQYDNPLWSIFYMKSEDHGQTFSTPLQLTGESANGIDPKVTAMGENVTVGWIRPKETLDKISVVYRSSYNSGQYFGPTRTVPGCLGFAKNMDMSAQGDRVYFCWEEYAGSSTEVKVSYVQTGLSVPFSDKY